MPLLIFSLLIGVVADLPNFCLHSEIMGEWRFHVGTYKRKGETDVDGDCGFNRPDGPDQHEHLKPEPMQGADKEGHYAPPANIADPDRKTGLSTGGTGGVTHTNHTAKKLKGFLDDGGINNDKGQFFPETSYYVDMQHNWFAGGSEMKGAQSDDFVQAAGWWTLVYTEGWHAEMIDIEGQSHSFRAFSYYDLKDGHDARENSPVVNAKHTDCGRTLLGWYVKETKDGVQSRKCFWGAKMDSQANAAAKGGVTPSNHFHPVDEAGSLLEAKHADGSPIRVTKKEEAHAALSSVLESGRVEGNPVKVDVKITIGADSDLGVPEAVLESKHSDEAPDPSSAYVSSPKIHTGFESVGKALLAEKYGIPHAEVPFAENELASMFTDFMGNGDGRHPTVGFVTAYTEFDRFKLRHGAISTPNAAKEAAWAAQNGPDTGRHPTNYKHYKHDQDATWQLPEACKGKLPDVKAIAALDWSAENIDVCGVQVAAGHDMGPVESQSCGTCYGVASSTHLTARLRLKYPKHKDAKTEVSWSHATNCNYYNQGCDGGFPYWVMTGWSDKMGVKSKKCWVAIQDGKHDDRNSTQKRCSASESICEFAPGKAGSLGRGEICEAECPSIEAGGKPERLGIESWGYIGGSYGRCQALAGLDNPGATVAIDNQTQSCEEEMMKEILRGGPIVVAIEPAGEFSTFASGVLGAAGDKAPGPHRTGTESIYQTHHLKDMMQAVPPGVNMCPDETKICYHYEKVDHSVVVFGWGVEAGVKYWLLRNSWGKGYGVEGSIKVQRGADVLSIESIPVSGNPIDFNEPTNMQQKHSFVQRSQPSYLARRGDLLGRGRGIVMT